MSGKVVRLGAGMAFWGDSVRPAIEMVERGDIDYLCCDHLAELTMSILAKQRAANPERGYTRDVIDLLRGALPACVEKGVKVVTNAGGANPRAAARAIRALADELGLPGVRIAVVLGDDIEDRIDDLDGAGVSFDNLDTGAELDTVRDRLTHAAVYTGCEGIVEALDLGADIVVCGRVTDIALYLGPLSTSSAGRSTTGSGSGWPPSSPTPSSAAVRPPAVCTRAAGPSVDGLETLGYPIAEVQRGRHRGPHQDARLRRESRHRHGQRAAGLRDPRPGHLPDRRRHRRLHPGDARGGRPRPRADHRRHRQPASGDAQGQHGLPRRVRRRGAVHLHLARRLRQGPARTRVPAKAAGARRLPLHRGHRRVPRSHLDVGVSGPGAGRP